MLLLPDHHLRARGPEQRGRGLRHIGQQPVRQALQEQQHPPTADAGDRDRRARPRTTRPRGPQRNRRQGAPAGPLRAHRQRRHLTPPQRRAQHRRHPHPGRHRPPRRPGSQRRALPQRQPLFFHHPPPHVQDLRRERDRHRAHRLARPARHTQALRARRRLQAVVERRRHQPNRPRINMSKRVSPHDLVGRTDIRARAAADAAQGRPRHRIRRHRPPPVVHQHDVQLVSRGRPRDERRIRRDRLRRRRARQQPHLPHRVRERRHDLLDPRRDHMYRRQAGRQPPVALIRDQHHPTRLRDQRVRARHPHPRCQEAGPQPPSSAGHHCRNVVRVENLPQRLAQHRRHLLPTLMDRWHHQMAGPVGGQLQDPLAQVTLDRANPPRCQVVVHLQLFRHHRLALDHQIAPARPTELRDVAVRILRRGGRIDRRPSGGRLGPELRHIAIEIVDHTILDRGQLPPQLVEAAAARTLQLLYLRPARFAPRALECQQPRAHIGILHRRPVALAERPHPTTATCSDRGPCTPIVNDRSMSAVRDGPVVSVA